MRPALFLFIFIILSSSIPIFGNNFIIKSVFAQQEFRQNEFTDEGGKPSLNDKGLQVQTIAKGLELPTTMAFVGPDDILVLEKDKGTVREVINGKLIEEPLLDVNVASAIERCMCGIAVSQNGTTTYVFLYYTETEGEDGSDRSGNIQEPIGNRLYRYELVDHKLINPKLLLDLPSNPGPRHNGGAITVGPDGYVYIPIGDVDGTYQTDEVYTLAQNNQEGGNPDGRGGILRITQDGKPVDETIILGNKFPLNLYYAYGIRNSFGIGFDPLTGNLWDTENGPGNSDEINLVEPGFNSGWQPVMGSSVLEETFDESELVTFGGKGKYSEPELVWTDTAGPTAITFLSSDRLGKDYQDDIFVGDVHNGFLYHFDLNDERNELILSGELADKIIEKPNPPDVDQIIFGKNFGGITDIEVGPDGYLYIVSIAFGKIFRIVPS